MGDLVSWWFGWGAVVFFVTTLLVAALVLFDSFNRRVTPMGWKLAVILPPMLILFSVLLKTQLAALPPGSSGLAQLFFWIGAIAGLVAVIAAIGYFMTVAAQPPRVVVDGNIRGNGGLTIGSGSPSSSRRPRPSAPGMLVLRGGPGGVRQYQLSTGRNTIGRDPDCDVMVDDPDVSRDHAHIQERNGRFLVADRGSTHGTFLNGQRVRGETHIVDNDEIRLGPTITLIFKQF